MIKRLPKITFATLRKTLLIIIILSGVFSVGYLFGSGTYGLELDEYPKVTINRGVPKDRKNLDFNLFWTVWDTLDTRYFDKEKLIPAKMVYGAVQGMVSAIGDPYTVFLPPSENKVIQEDLSGSFQGVGIQIGFKGSQLAIIAPLPNSPAQRAGVKASDFIIGITDDSKGINRGTVGITLPEAVQAIRGPAGTPVTLSLLRDGSEEIIETEIIRENIEVPSVVLDFVGENQDVAHIQILKFVAETESEWEEAIISILSNPQVNAVIIDVRNNPGGFLQAAVGLASDILEIESVVVTEEQASGEEKEFKVDKLGRLRNMNVVMLVNKGSASASEILAGALRDVKGIKIVGETTFGKGTIQEPQQIDGAGLHITVARWLTPSGYWVDEKGLVPDVEVVDDVNTDEDEQLEKAIELLNSKI